MAGFRELLTVEWDNNAVETFRLNFPDVPVWQGDIMKLTVEEVLRLTGIGVGELDVLDGSPPCQGFSTTGKRQLNDARNGLFREYVRLLRGLRPKAFIMENVSGLVKGKMKLIFAEILRELKMSGYRVSARLLNAMYFHVPQSRERLIFIGVREDLKIEPSHPRAQNHPFTVREAFEGLSDEPDERIQLSADSKTAQQMSRVPPGGRCSKHFNHHRLTWNRPSPTISSWDAYFVWHPSEQRPITVSECRRLCSYPDEFRFTGTVSDAFRRMGNSVPSLFMSALASHVRVLLSGPADFHA